MMQKIIFEFLFPIGKIEILKKNFLGKSQNHKVFILHKVKLGVGVYFSGAI